MSRDFKLLICSLNWTSSDTTGHDTGLGTGLSLAHGSGNCCDFIAALLFNGIEEIMIFGVIFLQTVAGDGVGGGGCYSDIFILT